MPNVRVLRVIEYTGDAQDVLEHLSNRGVISQRSFHGISGKMFTVREGLIGEFPEYLNFGDMDAKVPQDAE